MSMISRYIFGTPLPTMAVIREIAPSGGEIPHFTVTKADGSVSFTTILGDDDLIFGLGENVRGINKRGWHYVTNNTDEARHSEDKLSYYGAHNFLLIRNGEDCFGLFVDFPGKVHYDIGYTRHDTLCFHTEEPDYELYVLSGGDENALCKEFRALIGRSYIPPKWAFGLAQSRWGYKTEEDVREVARQYKANGLPLDMICMDIDYMQGYADFTVNRERFPDLKKLSDELKAEGIISGGMIPKVECCTNAIRAGVRKVFIIDGRVPHALLIETLTDEGAGTMFKKEIEGNYVPKS